MSIMNMAPFVFSAETYCILDVVNSHGNSGRGTLAKQFMFCVVESQHLGMCLSTHKLHVFYLLHCSSLRDLLLKVNVTWRMPSNCSF